MEASVIGFCVALGIGLLIGAERERRKGSGPHRKPAGVRTFTVASLMGAVGMMLGDIELLIIIVLLVGSGVMIAYHKSRNQDPGLTTELALVLTSILGGLAIHHSVLAAGMGVLLALILAGRNHLHHFVKTLITEQDIQDALLFGAIALIVLPLVPDRYLGPWDALNPRNLVILVVVVMAISAAGYIGTRWLGPRYGLPLSGFAAGFISSTATIHSMGQRVSAEPAILLPAVSGAALSSVATMIQMAVLIALVAPSLLMLVAIPLLLGGVVATAYGLVFLFKCVKATGEETSSSTARAFNLKTSIGFALLLSAVVLVSAALNAWLGERGLLLSALVAGLADAHAAGASTASLMASGKIAPEQAVLPILVGLTANTVTKTVVAFNGGGRMYARMIVPGLGLMMAAVWGGFWFISMQSPHPIT